MKPSARSAGADLVGRLEAALAIAGRLAACRDRASIEQLVVDAAVATLEASAAAIHEPVEDRFELAAWAGAAGRTADSLPDLPTDEAWRAAVGRRRRTTGQGDRLGVPLRDEDRLLGVLSIDRGGPGVWTPADERFVETLASHAAIALANAARFEEMAAQASHLAVLQAASARLAQAGTALEVGRAVVEEIRAIIPYDDARIYLAESGERLVPIVLDGRVGPYDTIETESLISRPGEGFAGWVFAHDAPILADDAGRDPRGLTIGGTDDLDESILAVPMRHDGATIGVISLSKLGLGRFGTDELRLLSILADQAAIAIGSARFLARTQDLARELRQLLDMSAELSGSLDPRQVADLMAGHLARAMAVEGCLISYWDRTESRIESLGAYPTTRLATVEPYFDVSGYPKTLEVLEGQQTVIIDADDPAADPAEVELMVRDGTRVLAMLPLVAKGQAIGLVELIAGAATTFSDDRLALARTMANEAAMALENARLYEEARNLADRDRLTGFYNHRFLHERLGEEVVRAQRGRRQLSLLMLDLDDFKLVNDTFGHQFGDRVLSWTAELITSTLRGSDIAARYGGDEFAIVLPETDAAEARHAADRILEAFRQRPFVGEQRGPVPMAASIGMATFPADGRTATDLIAAADDALYRVKREGGHDAARAASTRLPASPVSAA